ncbi:DUF3592 domain-containing protein [Nocardiopsis sediminis]|uniref:DUF3592 domain-containing protein n=1 Tax=Nocardiopsis sediminis TaxID=1778267 RepID=A0ABV8FK34_9ACTN
MPNSARWGEPAQRPEGVGYGVAIAEQKVAEALGIGAPPEHFRSAQQCPHTLGTDDTVVDYYPLLPIGAGLVMLALLLRHLRFSSFLARKGVRAVGEIVGYAETATTSRMIVRFRTYDGREIEAAHTSSTGWTAARAGDTVTVSYPPGQPEKARVVRARWLSSGIDLMLGLLGATMIAIGLLLGYFAWDGFWPGGEPAR